MSAGRYVRSAYHPGQEISLGDVRGRITALEAASTLLENEQGQSLRVPNHLLLESIVTIYSESEDPDSP